MTDSSADLSVEASLDDVRATAKRLQKVSKELEATFRSLEQAAATGHLVKLTSSAERAAAAHQQLGEEIDRLSANWLLDESAVDEALGPRLMSEVAQSLKQRGVDLHRYGSGWSASPVLLKIDGKSRSLKIDRKRLTTLRPSVIAAAVAAARHRPSVRPEQFIEVLYAAYRAAVASISLLEQPTRLGSSVPLSEVYRSLTLLPESRREYSVESFARDLFVLDRSGVATTKEGLRLFFSSSTSSKGGGGVLTVLDESGVPHNYFAVAFREVTG
jgi:hypothetical protein